MVYQTGWLPSLFRIRMRIRLTYSCTGTNVALSILFPFRILPFVLRPACRTTGPVERAPYVRAIASEGRKRSDRGQDSPSRRTVEGKVEERRRRGRSRKERQTKNLAERWERVGRVYRPGTVYKVDRGIIMFARLCNALAFQIDSSGALIFDLEAKACLLIAFSFAAVPPPYASPFLLPFSASRPPTVSSPAGFRRHPTFFSPLSFVGHRSPPSRLPNDLSRVI